MHFSVFGERAGQTDNKGDIRHERQEKQAREKHAGGEARGGVVLPDDFPLADRLFRADGVSHGGVGVLQLHQLEHVPGAQVGRPAELCQAAAQRHLLHLPVQHVLLCADLCAAEHGDRPFPGMAAQPQHPWQALLPDAVLHSHAGAGGGQRADLHVDPRPGRHHEQAPGCAGHPGPRMVL